MHKEGSEPHATRGRVRRNDARGMGLRAAQLDERRPQPLGDGPADLLDVTLERVVHDCRPHAHLRRLALGGPPPVLPSLYQSSCRACAPCALCPALRVPYVLDAVAQLRDLGVRIGSTTGYNDKMMDVVVPCAAEQGNSPDFWITPDAVGGKGRPWPFMVFRNMEALAVDDVLHVAKAGDTVSDIKEGVAADMLSVGVVEGSSVMGLSEDEYAALDEDAREDACARAERVFREAGADAVIRNFEELPALMRQIG